MENGNASPGSGKRKGRRAGSRLLKGLLGASVLLLVVFLAWETLVAAVSDVQFLSRQEVSETVPLEGMLIKEEKVIRSPAGGKLRLIAADGKRLEVGAGAAQVIAAEQDAGDTVFQVSTPVAGIFCNHLDGLEGILSPENLDVLDLPRLEKIGGKPVSDGERVEKGQPIFKLVDNLSPMLIATRIPKSDFPEDLADKPRWMTATWGNLELKIKPHKLIDKGDAWEGFFLLSDYPEQLLHYREARLTVTSKTLKGYLVPGGAVVYRDGAPGIYLAVKKKARWIPVKVEGELNGKAAVAGQGLSDETRYVINPVLVREGWPVE